MTTIASLPSNQHESSHFICSIHNQPYCYYVSHCSKDPYCHQCFQEESKVNHQIEKQIREESNQLFIDSSSFKPVYTNQKHEINNCIGKMDLNKLVTAKKEAFNYELSTFIAGFMKIKVNEIINKEYQESQGEYMNENQMSRSNIIEFNSNSDNSKEDDYSSQLFALNQIKLMQGKFLSSSNSLILLLNFAFESFFNQENSVEASFEKEINDIMNDTLSNCNLYNVPKELISLKEMKNEFKQNTNTNQSTSIPSNFMKMNDYDEMKQDQHFDSISPSELSSPLAKEEVDLFLSSMIYNNNNNNNNICSLNSSDSSILISQKEDKTPFEINEQQEESESTRETRLKIEELILKKTSNKSNEFEPLNSNKVSRKCIDCQKTFISKPEQIWRTRCYNCQLEFKRVSNETNYKKGTNNEQLSGETYLINTKSCKLKQSGKVKQVCVDCKKIFIVPIELLRKRKRCFNCYKELHY